VPLERSDDRRATFGLRRDHPRTPAVDERYAPLLDILPMQRLALALALHRGEDPDAPRSLKKVTTTL